MIQRIQKSKAFRLTSVFLIMNILAEIISPMRALALTGGPAQPEFGAFTPVGTTDMVDLSSGDLNYNIPLMDVGGYPINIAYHSGIGMDDEASWVGLGWNLSVGQINRNVRGLPDDFKGDQLTYENNLKPNVTVGANLKFQPGFLGFDFPLNVGLAAMYNNYEGFTLKESVGMGVELSNNVSIGFNLENGPDGMAVSPSLSIHKKGKDKQGRNTNIGTSIGASLNSRQGLTSTSLNVSRSVSETVMKTARSNGKSYAEGRTAGNASTGSVIGFAANSYTPTKRVGMSTGTFTVNASIGSEFFGGEGSLDVTAYGTVQKVREEEQYKKVGAYGYEHSDQGNTYSVLDFNREKEGPVTVNATNLAVTNYTYDIYSIQGQGVGGMYRPYRNQVGYVYDAHVQDGSLSGSLGLEFGAGNAVHVGVDVEVTQVSSYSGLWEDNNYMLDYLKETYGYNPRYEKVHFKNVGDMSADEEMTDTYTSMFNRLGRYQALRISYAGNKFHRRAISEYKEKIDGEGNEAVVNAGSPVKRGKRQSRNQAIFNLTVADLLAGIGYGPVAKGEYASVPAGSKPYVAQTGAPSHHTAEVQVVRNDGARYVYGLPAYNTTKKEATFAVTATGNAATGLVDYAAGVDNSASNHLNDRYFNRVTTPAYVHTYLLTSVLSKDYQDRGTAGPSAEDLGNYTKMSYDLKDQSYKWRVPFGNPRPSGSSPATATYNEGLKTTDDDDQGNYVYGEKELFFIKKIETKTHVAIFTLSSAGERHDGYGVKDENGGIDLAENSYFLKKISLYSKAEYDANPSTAVPIKEANFEYDFSLCTGIPNNDGLGGAANAGGKLTLKKIYFTYRGSKMGKYNSYKFNYANANPSYNIKGYDYWGNYQPNAGTGTYTGPVSSAEFAYTPQDQTLENGYASSWTMSSVDLPSGGRISMRYEADDYAYVQDKAALRMYKIMGADNSDAFPSIGSITTQLYAANMSKTPNKYLYFDLGLTSETTSITSANVAQKLIGGIGKYVHFRFLTNTTQSGGSGITNSTKCDYISGYMEVDGLTDPTVAEISDQGGHKYARIRVKLVDRNNGSSVDNAVHPITMATWNFGKKYLNKYVYSNQPNGETDDIQEIVTDMLSPQVLTNLKEILMGPNSVLETRLIGRSFVRDKSWIRLKTPLGKKLGGGCRVAQIVTSDIWEQMNGETLNAAGGYQTMNYGQSYSYKQADNVTTSGVATYEPMGNKENPFVQPVFSTTKHILAPDEDNYVEQPFGESFFPSPQVTYSRVTVKNVSGGTAPAGQVYKNLHKTGSVVTEFYTSQDYPTIVDETVLDANEDKRNLLGNLLKVSAKKHFTASQGYVIHLNDMNGKQKSERVYAEGQDGAISGKDYIYDNNSTDPGYNASTYPERNKGTLNNLVKVIYPNGDIKMKVLGVEEDVVNDFMYNQSESNTGGVNMNVGMFFAAIIPIVAPIPLPDISHAEDRFQAVSTTKVINTFGILREVVAYEDGTSVSTRNLAWDAVTGEVLVTQTVNEFSDNTYTMNYPAHWFYKGMGQASENLGLTGTFSGSAGVYGMQGLGASQVSDYLIAGDEIVYGSSNLHAWVSVVNGNTFRLIDASGAAISTGITAGDALRVVRSGHRNQQSAGIMSLTLMKNPLQSLAGVDVANLKMNFNSTTVWPSWKVIISDAADYSDNWPAGCECGIGTGVTNAYLTNARGVWRMRSNQAYLSGRISNAVVNPRLDGFYAAYSPMYKISSIGTWAKDMTGWTTASQVSRFSPYGFEIENVDALGRYSASQYGYNNAMPMAVGHNTRYRQIGFDGFEDYGFNACNTNPHFNYKGIGTPTAGIAHTGNYSMKIVKSTRMTMTKPLTCN